MAESGERRAAKPRLAESMRSRLMDGIIYLVGLIVVILAILSFLGFR